MALAFRPGASHTDGAETGFLKRLVRLEGAEYRYQVYVPPGWSKAVSWPVILSLHGAGGYGSDGKAQVSEGLAAAVRRHPERFPALIVFPQSPLNGEPGWQGVGGRIAMAALEQTVTDFHGDRSRVTLTGYSIGGNGTWYLAYHHPDRFAALLVICGFVIGRQGVANPIYYPALVPGPNPSATIAQHLAGMPVWMFHGDADRVVPVENSRLMFAALRAVGTQVQYTELAGVDHNAWDPAYARTDVDAWLLQHRRPPP